MSHYIYSTLAAPMAYTTYIKENDKDISVVESVVHIKGGAGVMDAKNIQTPRGVMTEVTSQELEALMRNYVFKMHLDNNFITIEDKVVKMEKVTDDMNLEDESRPITPADFVKDKDGVNKLKRGNK